jgi:hypothetical protein
VASEQHRIDAAFTELKASLLERYRTVYKDATGDDIKRLLRDFAAGLISESDIEKAAQAGIDAVPSLPHVTKPDAHTVAAIWIGKVRKYQREFPGKMGDEIAAAASEAESAARDQGLTEAAVTATILDAIEAKIEAFRYDASLYAEPSWSAGNQGYGETLDASDVTLDWICEADACPICAPLPDGNPYTTAALPMWPGDPHPNCRCYVTPSDESWTAIFGEAAA